MSCKALKMKQHPKRQDVADKRAAPRFSVSVMPTSKTIIQNDWFEVDMINISRRGALINSHQRMTPGSSVFLRVITEETTYIIKGRTARCSISPTKHRRFKLGIEFNEDLTPLPESIELLELFEGSEDFLK
jgi:hypothetical protein